MKARCAFLAVLAVGLVVPAGIAWSEPEELQIDGWSNGMYLAWQLGFAADEAAVVRLSPKGIGPWRIDYVYFPFGPDTDDLHQFDVEIYDDPGDGLPGELFFTGLYEARGSSTEAASANLYSKDIEVDGPFWLAVRFKHSGSPAVGRDDDATIRVPYNLIHVPGQEACPTSAGTEWCPSADYGLTGDWIIRAGVSDIGAGDSGPFVVPFPTIEIGPPPKDDGGCRANGPAPIVPGALALLCVLCANAARRSRRAPVSRRRRPRPSAPSRATR